MGRLLWKASREPGLEIHIHNLERGRFTVFVDVSPSVTLEDVWQDYLVAQPTVMSELGVSKKLSDYHAWAEPRGGGARKTGYMARGKGGETLRNTPLEKVFDTSQSPFPVFLAKGKVRLRKVVEGYGGGVGTRIKVKTD